MRGFAGISYASLCIVGHSVATDAHTIGLAERFFFIPDYTSVNSSMAARSGERSIVTLNDAVHITGTQI